MTYHDATQRDEGIGCSNRLVISQELTGGSSYCVLLFELVVRAIASHGMYESKVGFQSKE